MRSRTRIRKRLQNCSSEQARKACVAQLTIIEGKLRLSYEQQSTQEESKAVASIKRNPKYFFAYAKKKSKTKTNIGPLRTPQKSLTTSASKMANILSDQYASAFSKPRYENDDPKALFPDVPNSPSTLDNICFADDDLEEAMRELRLNAAAGPDGIPAILLNKCASALAPPLASIWRKSMKDGDIPLPLKSATIVPIHKGKSKALAKNYRPVALTSQLCKVFEKVVRKQLVSFMEENNLLNPNQHGFRSGRSCLSQLLSHFDKITSLLEKGLGVDVIYLDFAKAFDKVDIGITLRKLHDIGVRGRLGRWLVSFLTGRLQTVTVEGRKSQPQPVISGVPQGSVLGPLLFLVLLGNIDENAAHTFVSSFADDTRVGMPISSSADPALLQQDLRAIYDWSKQTNMEFNSEKFELLSYQAIPAQPRPPQTYLSDVDTAIEAKDDLRDLGVTLSNDATFSTHIAQKVTSVRKLSSWALRTFRTRLAAPMLTIWKTLIMCHIDYCSQLWSPYKMSEIQAIEDLQRSFLRKISSVNELSYWDQLKHLKLYSLQRRRERYSIIYTWRILEEQVPNLSAPISASWHIRRGRLCNVPHVSRSPPAAIQSIRENSFAVRGPKLFNSLPSSLRNLTNCTVDTFKHALDRHLAIIPDQPPVPGLTQFRLIESNSITDWAARIAREESSR